MTIEDDNELKVTDALFRDQSGTFWYDERDNTLNVYNGGDDPLVISSVDVPAILRYIKTNFPKEYAEVTP